jgi:carbon storage regulator
MMLVLTRRLGESILIGDNIRIVVVEVQRGRVRIGIEAPQDVVIRREELPPLTVAKEPVEPKT